MSDDEKANYWKWSNTWLFEAGYALRSAKTTVLLPTLKPFRDGSLTSANDADECGPVNYVINTDDDTLFEIVSY